MEFHDAANVDLPKPMGVGYALLRLAIREAGKNVLDDMVGNLSDFATPPPSLYSVALEYLVNAGHR